MSCVALSFEVHRILQLGQESHYLVLGVHNRDYHCLDERPVRMELGLSPLGGARRTIADIAHIRDIG